MKDICITIVKWLFGTFSGNPRKFSPLLNVHLASKSLRVSFLCSGKCLIIQVSNKWTLSPSRWYTLARVLAIVSQAYHPVKSCLHFLVNYVKEDNTEWQSYTAIHGQAKPNLVVLTRLYKQFYARPYHELGLHYRTCNFLWPVAGISLDLIWYHQSWVIWTFPLPFSVTGFHFLWV